jgi:hypothetical protein
MYLSVYSDEGKGNELKKKISSVCTDIVMELNPLTPNDL